MTERPQLLDVVALLEELPDAHLPRGQVGTVVEALDPDTVLVEFSDDRGLAHAVVPVPAARLLALRFQPAAVG